ncbi:MAG TPA: endonuclease/exonuclease/phosphatase family protein, partial [Chloroflexia bacterium]|nr:endonuclease/exonuclease/phosphatase family protein [Chloroflexia bacterium]
MDAIAASGGPLVLGTYNCHLGGAEAAVAALLTGWAPTILCLQETRDPAGHDPAYQVHWQAAPGRAWGSALLVRGAALAPVPLPADLAGWVVGAILPAPPGGRPLRVFSVHAPPLGGSYIRTVGRILDVVADGAAAADLILGGDFNVVVGRRGPDERVHMSRAEAALLTRIEEELGLL